MAAKSVDVLLFPARIMLLITVRVNSREKGDTALIRMIGLACTCIYSDFSSVFVIQTLLLQ